MSEKEYTYEVESTVCIIEKSRKGSDYTYYLENGKYKKYILSKYTPKEDAMLRMADDLGNKNTIWIIFGFNFGYLINEIIEKVGNDVKFIIIEPNERFLHDQIEKMGLGWMEKTDNISFYSGTDFRQFKALLRKEISEEYINNVRISTLENYIEFYIEYYKCLVEQINEFVDDMIINRNTFNELGKLFVKNFVLNSQHIQKSFSLERYKNIYKNIPALIVSAGPSLNKNIALIKEFKGIIFTGGRTLTPVLEQGIKPDFLVSVDPKDVTYDTLLGNAENDLPLITVDQGNHKVIHANKGRQYFLPSNYFNEIFIGKKLSPMLATGGSVATVCLSAAEYMGCSPVIFIGQDLAFTEMKMYADSCKNERVGIDDGLSNTLKKEEKKIEFKEIEGYRGTKVYTNPLMLGFLRWFEEFIQLNSKITYINATEGGAHIKGTIEMSFREAIEEYCLDTLEKVQPQEEQPYLSIDIKNRFEKVVEDLEGFSKLTNDASKISDEILKLHKVYKTVKVASISKLMKKLDKLDKRIGSVSQNKEIIAYLFEGIYMALQNEYHKNENVDMTQAEIEEQTLSNGCDMYKALTVTSEEMIEVIRDTLKEMDKNE